MCVIVFDYVLGSLLSAIFGTVLVPFWATALSVYSLQTVTCCTLQSKFG